MRDVHTVQAPEQIAFEYEVAGIGSRALAYAIDLAIRTGVPLLAFVVCTLANVDLLSALRQPGVAVVVLLSVYVYFLGYYVLFETLNRGQSPGKQLLRLRVVGANGVSVDLYGSMIRNILRLIDQLPIAYTVGILVMFANRRAQRIGDLVAGSIVVKEQHTGLYRIRQLGYGLAEPAAAAFPGCPQMSTAEYEILHDYLTRRTHFTPEARQQLGRMLFDRLLPRQPDAVREQLLGGDAKPGEVLERLANAYRQAQQMGRTAPPTSGGPTPSAMERGLERV